MAELGAVRKPGIAQPLLASYALIGGVLSFVGWYADVPRLTDWLNSGISIQPNAAIAVVSAAIALLLLRMGYRPIAGLLGAFVFVIGITVLFEYATGIDLGIDSRLLFGREWGRGNVVAPGRMGPPGAISWTLLGLALGLASFRPTRRWPRAAAPALALLAMSIATMALIGYIYGVNALYTVPTATVIALQTSTFILTISIAVVLSVPEHAPMRLLDDTNPAGALALRMLPAVVLVPIALGLVRLSAQQAGLVDLSSATAARTIAEIVLMSTMLWWAASRIGRQTVARRQAEDQLVEQARILRTVTDEAGVGLAIVGPDHRYRYANRTYGEMVSADSTSIAGRRMADVFGDLYQTAIRPHLEQAFNGRSVQYDLSLPGRDRLLSVSYQPQAINGLVSAVIVSVVDLTDSQLLQRISAEIIHEDDVQSLYGKIVDSAIIAMRSELASLQMLQPAPGGTGDGLLKLLASRGFAPDTAEFWTWIDVGSRRICAVAVRTRARVVVSNVATSAFVAGSEELPICERANIHALQATPLISRDGRILGVLSTYWTRSHDPSDRELRLLDVLARQAADLIERRQAEESLRDADRRKNEFLAILAHELRNPLAPVRNAVELMQRRSHHDPVLERSAEVIERQVSLMARLLDDLLDIGRITSDKLELRRERVNLATAIQDTVDMCRPLLQQHEHDLSIHIPSPDPIYVDADPARLGQVFGNLLNNACRYTEKRGRIRMALERDQGQAVITIDDSGVGIPRDQYARIFEMFSQVDRPLNSPRGGLGIGLHLVKRLVEMHGGTIDVQSEGAGHGSRFTVRLPALVETAAVAAPAPETERPAASPARRILVVDDNADNAELLATLLQIEGHDVHTAHDGLDAVNTAERLRPDVVLLDIGLPVIDGFDACRRIREQPWGRQMLLIAITGWGQDSDRRKSHEAGFDHHLVKPVDARMITSLMANTGSSLAR